MNDFLYEGSDGELCHWGIKKGEAKQDHKYTKREWKNGRWVYYYDNGTREFVSTKNTNKLLDSKSSLTLGNDKYTNIERGRLSRYADRVERDYNSAKKAVSKNKAPGVRDTDELLSRETKINGVTTSKTRGKIDRAISIGEEFVKRRVNGIKRDYNSAKKAVSKNKASGVRDTNELLSRETKINGVTTSKTRGKIDRAISIGEEYVKRRFA